MIEVQVARVPRPARGARLGRKRDWAAREGLPRARSSAATGVSAMLWNGASRRTSRAGRSRSSVEWPASFRMAGAGGVGAVQLRAPPQGREVGTHRRVLGKLRDRCVLSHTGFADVDRRLPALPCGRPRCPSGPVAAGIEASGPGSSSCGPLWRVRKAKAVAVLRLGSRAHGACRRSRARRHAARELRADASEVRPPLAALPR